MPQADFGFVPHCNDSVAGKVFVHTAQMRTKVMLSSASAFYAALMTRLSRPSQCACAVSGAKNIIAASKARAVNELCGVYVCSVMLEFEAS